MTDKKKKEWERLYDQLGFGKGTMRDSLLAILFLAKSQTEIERLNNLLPPSCQVLSKDLPALKKVRKAMLANGGPDSDDLQGLLTSLAVGSRSMEVYYKELMMEERTRCQIPFTETVTNTTNERGQGVSNLCSTLFGESVDVELYLSEDRRTLGVRIIKWSLGLTRDFVQQLLGHEVLRTLQYGGLMVDSRKKGIDMDYWLPLDVTPYRSLIQMWKNCWIEDGFTEKLEGALHELGLEIGPIVPDLTVAKNG